MARGAQKTAENNANTGLVNSNQFNTKLEGQNDALQGDVLGGYKAMLANPGYDAATKTAITNDSQGAAGSAFASASDQMARTAARTNNSAGVVAGQDQLAREKAQTMGGIADKNQIAFADAAKRDTNTALSGMSSLYGVDQTLLAKSLGIPVEYLNSYIAAGQMQKGGFTGAFSNALGKGLGTLASGGNLAGAGDAGAGG